LPCPDDSITMCFGIYSEKVQSPIVAMDAHQTMVTAALAAKSSAETPKKVRSDARSETMRGEIFRPRWRRPHSRPSSALVVLVVAAPPRLGEIEPVLVPAPRGEVEELVGPHQGLDATGVGGVGVVDSAVLEREDAHTLFLWLGLVDMPEV